MSTVTFDVDGSGNFTPVIVASGFTSIEWDWGDATTTDDDISPTKNYATGGTRTVTLTVSPDAALTSIAFNSETLLKTVPVVADAPNLATVNLEVCANLAGSTDALLSQTSITTHRYVVSGVTGNLNLLAGRSNLLYVSCGTDFTGDTGSLSSSSSTMTNFRGETTTNVTCDIEDFANFTSLYLAYLPTSTTGDIGNLTNVDALQMFICESASANGILNLPNNNWRYYRVENSSIRSPLSNFANSVSLSATLGIRCTGSANTAADNNEVLDLYDARNTFNNGPLLRLASTENLSGNYIPPTAATTTANWNWDGANHTPLTGNAALYALVNDPNGEGFNTWTVTYDYDSTTVSFDVDGAGDFAPVLAIGANYEAELTWDWGDVTTTNDDLTPTKNYATGGTRSVGLTVYPKEALTSIDFSSESLMKTLPAVADAPNLMTFYCDTCASMTGDISALSSLTALTIIYLNNTSVSGNISALSPLTSLTQIRLYSTSVSGDISALSPLTSLTQIRLHITSVSGDISALSPLTSLTHIYLHVTSLSGDISALSPLTSSKLIYLNNTSVSGNISALSPLTSLTLIYLYSTSVTGNISALSPLTSLSHIDLSSTSVSGDISAFSPLTSLTIIYLHNTALTASNLNTVLSLYANRNSFTASPTLKIETNAPLSGSYTVPPADGVSNGNWSWDGSDHQPLTGYAALYALVNDPNAEGFNTWTVTYDAQVAPSLTAPASIDTTRLDNVSYQIISDNPGNNVLIYSATGLPTGLSVNSSTGLITGSPLPSAVYTPDFIVDDGFGLSDVESVTWNINGIEFAEQISAGDVAVNELSYSAMLRTTSLTISDGDSNPDQISISHVVNFQAAITPGVLGVDQVSYPAMLRATAMTITTLNAYTSAGGFNLGYGPTITTPLESFVDTANTALFVDA